MNKLKINKTLILIIAMISYNYLFAELPFSSIKEKITEQWRWTTFGTYSGLPSNQIINLFETKNGTVFAQTSKGMIWYDNYKWNLIKDTFNLPYSRIGDIEIDEYDGVNLYYNQSIYKYTKYGIKKTKLPIGKIFSHVLEIKEGSYFGVSYDLKTEKDIWYFTSSKDKYEQASTYLKFNEKANGSIKDIFKSNDKNLWITTNKNIYYFENEVWKKIFIIDFKRLWVKDIIADNSGSYYIRVDYPQDYNGIWIFNKKNSFLKNIFPYSDHISSYALNLNNELFITDKLGNVQVNKKDIKIELKDPNTPDQLQGASDILFTKNNLLFTHDNSNIFLCRLGSSKWNYYNDVKELNQLSINGMCRDNANNLYLASYHGLGVLNNKKEFKMTSKIKGKSIDGLTSVLVDSKSNIWVSSGSNFDGVFKFSQNKWQHLGKKEGFPEAPVHKIEEDINGNIWFLTLSKNSYSRGKGAYKLKPSGKIEILDKTSGLSSDRVYDVLVEKNGTTWFGTVNGIFRLKNGKWNKWNNSNGIKSVIYTICLDNKGNLWFGGGKQTVGLIQNDSVSYPEIFKEFDVTEAMQISFDNFSQKLWISSKRGLFSFKNNVLTSFNKLNGLKTNNIWSFLIEKDSIVIGTNGLGINVLDLKEEHTPLPKIEIKSPLYSKGNIEISWNVFSYLGKRQQDQIPIRYKLDDGSWSKWNLERKINFNELSYGNHRFQIQALSSYGLFDEKGNSVTFEKERPIYLRIYFYLPLLSILFFALFNVVINIRKRKDAINQLQKLNDSLEQKVIEKTKDLELILVDLKLEKEKTLIALQEEKVLNEIKSNFISMISHEYRTPLTVILSSTYVIEAAILKERYDKVNDYLIKIQKSVDLLTKFVDDALQMNSQESEAKYSRNKEVNLYSLLQKTIDEFVNFDNKKNNLVLKCSQDIILYLNPNNLKIVLNILITNAIRYSKLEEITINVIKDSDNTIIEVIDKGTGISQDELGSIFNPFFRSKSVIGLTVGTGLGLAIAKRTARDLDADIFVESELGKGSKFSLVLKN